MPMPDKTTYHLAVVRPVWLPFNKTAELIVDVLMLELGYPTTGPKAAKYAVVVASMLKAAQTVEGSSWSEKPTYLGIQRKASAWSRYPLVGRDIAKRVIDDLIIHFGASFIEGSGDSGLHKDKKDKWRTDPIMSMYKIDLTRLPSDLASARFIEVGRPSVKVNKLETRPQRDRREAKRLLKGFLNNKAAKALDRDAHRASESRIQSLNEFWLKHPLVFPSGHAAASATRVFHDGRYDAGGRIYGAWTGLDQKEHRINCTIDDEAICEIDIRASQPTLFSSLLGYKLGGLKASDQWDDVYAELSHLAPTGIGWAVLDDTIDTIDMMKRNRSVAKKVVMALIGSGISLKAKATDDLAKDYGLTDIGWKHFRDRLITTIPAFDELEPRYNSKGDVDGYLNGAGFLSYHESELMLKTLGQLVELGIPAYPVHDSLMVKVSDATVAANTFRQVIHDYCKQLSGLEVLVPLSVTVADGISKELLPSNKELKGLYLS